MYLIEKLNYIWYSCDAFYNFMPKNKSYETYKTCSKCDIFGS